MATPTIRREKGIRRKYQMEVQMDKSMASATIPK
jgi:hypothetical protein